MINTPSLKQQKTAMPSFPAALLLTALVAGTLDAIGATTSYLLRGNANPANIWKYVASGVFGKPALTGGADMVAYGLLFHYFIAAMCTVVFFFAYPYIPFLARYKYLSGVLYALIVWVVTNLVILPLSQAPQGHFHVQTVLIGMFILVLAIGLPISLLAHRWIRH